LKRGPEVLRDAGAHVAPFTGAWIETIIACINALRAITSPPSRGRGLKRPSSDGFAVDHASPPSRGRGLKRSLKVRAAALEAGRPLHGGVD